MKKGRKKMKKGFCVAGMIIGIVIFILGIVLASKKVNYSSDTTISYTFGADFYTEIYGATRNVSNHTARIGNMLESALNTFMKVFGLVIMCGGAAIVCAFGCKLGDQGKPSPVPEPAAAAPAAAAPTAAAPAPAPTPAVSPAPVSEPAHAPAPEASEAETTDVGSSDVSGN